MSKQNLPPAVYDFLMKAAAKGGNATKKKYGKAHYKKMAKLGVEARRSKRSLVSGDSSKTSPAKR